VILTRGLRKAGKREVRTLNKTKYQAVPAGSCKIAMRRIGHLMNIEADSRSQIPRHDSRSELWPQESK
jgi:hypothetical protein